MATTEPGIYAKDCTARSAIGCNHQRSVRTQFPGILQTNVALCSRNGLSDMTNKDAADLLHDFADVLEIRGANTFRVRAFRTASRRVDSLTVDLRVLIDDNSLTKIQGIGKGIAGVLNEFLTTGHVAEYEEMREEIPPGVFDMLRVPGLGPKTTATLYNDLNITGVDELEAAARADDLASMKNFGVKRQARLLVDLQQFRERTARHLLSQVQPIAEQLVTYLRQAPSVSEAMCAGSLRRMRETVRDIDILAASVDPISVIDHFVAHDEIKEVVASGSTRARALISHGLQVDLLVVRPEHFGAALVYFTGSMDHNIELRQRALQIGVSLNEWGLDDVTTQRHQSTPTEAEVYTALGLPVIPPELRESRGEIAAAESGTLPNLITLADIRGEFHGHSLWSDGSASVDNMIQAARTLDYAFIAITDHSEGLQVAHGLSPKRIRDQRKEIHAAQEKFPDIRVMQGCEVEIQADGAMDFGDDVLEELDVVVASVHSNFNQPPETMTSRLIAAIRNPHVDLIGHPTGRLLGHRDGYDFDLDKVLTEAAETGTAMEINASPERLDLNDVMAQRAKNLGVPLAINSDAHQPEGYAYMRYGVATARRAWLTAGDVLNTMAPDALNDWLEHPKPRRWVPHR